MLKKFVKSRWYDNDPKAARVFQLIRDLHPAEREEFANNLSQVLNIVKRQKDSSNFTVSIGKNNLRSYYQAFNKRRWYDQLPELMRAMNTLSVLSVIERQDIIEGILISLDSEKDKIKL